MKPRNDARIDAGPDALATALSLARIGWHVFPVDVVPTADGHRDKLPLVKWLDGATDDAETIATWWGETFVGAHIGVHAKKSGIVVVDLDKHPDDGKANLDEAGIKPPKTFTYKTRGGGRHLVYRAPDDVELTIARGVPVKGVDIRAGHGLMVYYGPEVTERPYLADAPVWALVKRDEAKSGAKTGTKVREWLAAVQPGEADDDVVEAVHKVVAQGMSHDEMLDAVKEIVRLGKDGHPGTPAALALGREIYTKNFPDYARHWDAAVAGSIDRFGLPMTVLKDTRPPRPKPVKATKAEPVKPELTDAQREQDARAVAKAAPIEDGPISVVVTKRLRPTWAYVEGVGLIRWRGKVWMPADDKNLLNAIRKQLNRIYKIEKAKADQWHDEEMRQKRLAKLLVLHAKAKAANVAAFVHANLADHPILPDQHPDLLNVQNGIVDLRTGELSPHDPSLFMTKITKAEYHPDATDPDWQKALEALPAKVRPWLQVRFGQAITGHMTRDDKVVLLQGSGNNGKSSIVDGVRTAFGSYAVTVPERVLLSNPGDHPTELTTLMGVRLALIEELPEGRNLNVKRLKDTVGTPEMTARKMHKDSIVWRSTHSMFLTTNYLPTVNETDDGTWRRLLLVRFPYRFVAKGSVMKTRDRIGDEGLRDRLGEKPNDAILAWVIEGARRFYANGFPKVPEPVGQSTEEWRDEADPIMAYVAERIEMDPGYAIPSADLAIDFNDWLRNRGHKEWSTQTLNARLKDHVALPDIERKMTRFGERIKPSRASMFVKNPPTQVQAWQGIRFKLDLPDAVVPDEFDTITRGMR